MLTHLFGRGPAKAISPSLEAALSECDDHLLHDMGLLRDPANHLMYAPAEFYACDMTKFEGPKAA